MKYVLSLCVFVCAFIVACSLPAPAPSPAPSQRYAPPTQEVTNGICVVFAAVPSASTASLLTGAGAIASTNGIVFVFDTVNTDERRQAVTAALLSGAELKGLQR